MTNVTAVNPRLDAALALARYGFKIFPLQPNTKIPAIQNWRTLANDNEDLIRKWWGEEFPNANIGLATDGLCVIDIDPRNGGTGAWDALMLVEDDVDTATQETQSGGVHRLYKLPAGLTVPNSRSKLGKGIDIKSAGGYIVAPGSDIDGRPYRWFERFGPETLAPAPQWLLDQARAPRQRTSMSGHRVVEEDQEALDAACVYLREHAPKAEEGSRDNTAFRVAAKLFDYGVAESTAYWLLTEWNETKCSPPLEDHDIPRIIESAQRNRTRAIGSAHPGASSFEAHEIAPRIQQAPKSIASQLWERSRDAASKALTHAGDSLIKDVIDRGTMSVLYGESGAGKTFVALDMSAHISSGQSWNDRRVRQGAVVYVAAEGGRNIYKRLAALNLKAPELLGKHYVVRLDVDLVHDHKHVNLLVDICKQVAADAGVAVEMIIIDTLSRALAGGDENSPVDMGALVKNLDALRTATAAHVMVIHHSGKNKARGARGHSLLRAATDTEIEVNDNRVTATKQRDLDQGFEMAFKLPHVTIGEKDGDRITSCTVAWRSVKEAASDPAPLTIELQQLKTAIIVALPRGVKEFNWQMLDGKLPPKWTSKGTKAASRRRTIKRHLDKLVKRGHIRKMADNQWVLVIVDKVDRVDN